MSETAFLVEDFQELLSAARFSANFLARHPSMEGILPFAETCTNM